MGRIKEIITNKIEADRVYYALANNSKLMSCLRCDSTEFCIEKDENECQFVLCRQCDRQYGILK